MFDTYLDFFYDNKNPHLMVTKKHNEEQFDF